MLKIDSTHDMQEYMDLLSDSLEIYMDLGRLDRAFEEVCYATEDFKALTLLWLRIESGGLYNSVNSDNIIDFLCRIGVDMEKRYGNKSTKSISLDMKRVVNKLIEDGIAVEMLNAYKEFRSYKSYASTLRKLIDARKFHASTPTGRTLVKFPTHIEERDNLRVYYSDIAVVSVPKKYSNMITGPADNYFIAWCDYPQADWRFAYNLFIRDSENEKIMRSCDDAYEGLVRIVEGEEFDLQSFKERRNEYKTHCLSVFYNSKSTTEIARKLRDFYQSCPKYASLLYDLNVLYQFKLPIPCTSYFGFEQLIPEAAYPDAFVSKALNTPIQTFTSHIVNETVFGVLQKFWDLGYTKEDANVYYVRHDEPLFLFTKKVLKDAWVFKECSEIFIPGFTPIHLDFHYGWYYQEEDEALTNEINKSIESYPHVYSTYSGGEAENYRPVPTVESLYVQFFVEDNKTRVEVYDYRTGRRKTCVVELKPNENALDEVLNNEILDWLDNPEYLFVRNNGMEYIKYVGREEKTLMKIVDRYDSNVAIRGDHGVKA